MWICQNYIVAIISILTVASASRPVVPQWQTVLPDSPYVIDLSNRSMSHRFPWKLHSLDEKYTNLTANVPGDILTDLMRNSLIDDPFVDRNFLVQRSIWMGDGHFEERQSENEPRTKRTRTWIYTTQFELPTINVTDTTLTWHLVIEGIKMGAHVAVNDIPVGTASNQFLRYIFPLNNTVLSAQSHTTQHTLSVTFDPTIPVDGRFAACSGGWDWAPYVHADDAQGKRSYTFGIAKPMYLVATQHSMITHFVPKVQYLGPYPKEPISSKTNDDGPFELQLDVHLTVVPGTWTDSLDIVVVLPNRNEERLLTLPVPNTKGETVVTTKILYEKGSVDLWWPNGLGEQPLYDYYVGFRQDQNKPAMPLLHKRVGFRVSALVTTNETMEEGSPANANQEGSGQHGMYFRVNGALVMARGANFIPMDQLEGRLTDKAHRLSVQSAADANMNMIRVWGGGMVLPDAFYDACDEHGIMLYHDMMFGDEAGHAPVNTSTVASEVRHIVRSLASHPSIVVWNACNECSVVMGKPSEIYATFVMQTVAEEDSTRSIWPSSPSNHGWETGVNTEDSRPNGGQLATYEPRAFPAVLESHGPYMRSYSKDFPGVNGQDVGFPYDNTPPPIEQVPIGASFPNVFISEFGSSVMSSFESMTGTLSEKYWSLHGNTSPDNCTHSHGNENNCIGDNVLAERNYPCDSHVLAYFGGNISSTHKTSLAARSQLFQGQLYHCLMAQTLWMKGEIEKRRSTNTYGLLIWQLNENWPTGGWGCIEYGPQKGSDPFQVPGGRWKPLMHLLQSSLFRDVIAACGKDNLCYIRNDGQSSLSATVSLEAWNLGNSAPSQTMRQSFHLQAGTISHFELPMNFTTGCDVVLVQVQNSTFPASASSATLLMESTFLWQYPKDLVNLRNPVDVQVEISPNQKSTLDHHGMQETANVTLLSNKLAVFVVLTTRAAGRFHDNAFTLYPNQPKTISFTFFTIPNEMELLLHSLRVEHLGTYLSQTDNERSNDVVKTMLPGPFADSAVQS